LKNSLRSVGEPRKNGSLPMLSSGITRHGESSRATKRIRHILKSCGTCSTRKGIHRELGWEWGGCLPGRVKTFTGSSPIRFPDFYPKGGKTFIWETRGTGILKEGEEVKTLLVLGDRGRPGFQNMSPSLRAGGRSREGRSKADVDGARENN